MVGKEEDVLSGRYKKVVEDSKITSTDHREQMNGKSALKLV
jgi:hypothetical protein